LFCVSPTAKRWLWRAVKTAIVLAIFAGVGWTLYRNLEQLDTSTLTVDPLRLSLAGVFYLLALFPWALYWWWSLRALGQRPAFWSAVRAYYISHLGKYVPGKAMVPILRTGLIRGPEVRAGVTVVTVFYETLTVMAAGVCFAALAVTETLWLTEQWLVLIVVLLLIAIFLSPRLFNWLAARLAARFRGPGSEPAPPLPVVVFLGGLGLGALSWLGLGLSLWAAIRAVSEVPLEPMAIMLCTAFVALATVAGFVTPAPGGLGVREWILMELLTIDLGPGPAGIVAILLRVTWIIAELAAAGVLYPAGLVFSKKVRP
jgi:uncharacterized membrane protein YbhN (UPF0104 family)